jgi:hypothetical protein
LIKAARLTCLSSLQTSRQGVAWWLAARPQAQKRKYRELLTR